MNRMYAAAICAMVLASACSAPRPTTAQGLAEQLAKNGVAYDTIETARMPTSQRFRFDEGIMLVADDLWVEIIRIDDQRVFNIAQSAGALLTLVEVAAERDLPGKPDIFTRQPFLVVVRQEPQPGQVLAALNRILPATD